jgi:hypothetical protein
MGNFQALRTRKADCFANETAATQTKPASADSKDFEFSESATADFMCLAANSIRKAQESCPPPVSRLLASLPCELIR